MVDRPSPAAGYSEQFPFTDHNCFPRAVRLADVTDSFVGRLRDAFTSPNPAVPVTAVVLALPAGYVAAAAIDEPTAGFLALLLVGVRVPWLAASTADSTSDASADSTAGPTDSPTDPADPALGSMSDAAPDSTAGSTLRAALWAASTAVVVAAAFVGLYVAGVVLSVPPDVASPAAFFAAWVLAEPVVGGSPQ